MKIVIRTDSSQKIGSGHVMRCLTLAEELRKSGATAEFITRDHPKNISKQIINKGFKVYLLPNPTTEKQQNLTEYEQWLGVKQDTDADESIQIVKDNEVDCLIVDHYALDYNWEDKLSPYTKKTIVIDDLANRKHSCDLLLDQNYIHDDKRYDYLIAPDTIKLLGPKYTLLRKEFIENKKCRTQNITIKRVFVFFGGTDPDNLTKLAIKALAQPKLESLSVDIVIGSTNPHQSELKKEIEKHPNFKLHIQVDNISELMLKADLALGAGGATTWERMALGLPSLVVTISENQATSTKELDKDGFINWLGSTNQVNEQIIYDALLKAINNSNQLVEQSRKCQLRFNGNGAKIVSKLLTIGPDPDTLSVREAKTSDASLYFYWKNDTESLKQSFNKNTIEWHEHQEWFDNKLKDPDTIMLLIESSVSPIGQVRFDRKSFHYTIDYSLAKQFRGFGLAKVVLLKAVSYLSQKSGAFTLIGEVKENNVQSKKVFERLGFTKSSLTRKIGVEHYELQISPTFKPT
jgi:UDP-2,4-diacetamido-2,4,6-trideoxy-beta-L-altropyranose hydrolase